MNGAKRKANKILSLLLAVTLAVGIIPITATPARAAQSGDDLFTELGIDTVDPSPGETSNPYGVNRVTVQEVSELYIGTQNLSAPLNRGYTLYGSGSRTDLGSVFSNKTTGTNANDQNKYDAYLTAVGDFTGSGKRDKIVALGANTKVTRVLMETTTRATGQYGLFMFFIDPTTGGTSEDGNIFSLYQGELGNPWELNTKNDGKGGFLSYNAARDQDGGGGAFYNPIMLHNYMQVVTGDFTGDGIDEIAVYIPEPANPRVEIYQFYSGGSDWLTKAAWKTVFIYNLPQTYGNSAAPNRVSLAVGDLNYDGIDDLAFGYGSADYTNPARKDTAELIAAQSKDSTVCVMFGSGTGSLVQTPALVSAGLPAEFGLTIGDPEGTGRDRLILAGLTDITTAGVDGWHYDANTIMYIWQYDAASGFSGTELYAGPVQGADRDPQVIQQVRADVVALSRGVGQGDNLYYRGHLYDAGSSSPKRAEESVYKDYAQSTAVLGYDLDELTDWAYAAAFEYGLSAADLDGDGKEELVMSYSPVESDNDGPIAYPTRVAILEQSSVNKSGMRRANAVISDGQSLNLLAVRENLYRSYLLVATPDTDNDSRRLTFKSRAYGYSDPKLLAVMAGAPLWKELEYLDDGDGYIGESGTTWSESKGSGHGSSNSNTFSLGAYISFEHEVPNVYSFEMEFEYKHSWTWEFEKMTTVTETVSYGAAGYTDVVALYSIPMDIYTYEEEVEGEDPQEVYLNFPHVPSVTVMSVDEYEGIAAQYPDILPSVRGAMLTHTQGRPDSYPAGEGTLRADGKITDLRTYGGNFSNVGYGSGTQTQTISVEAEESEGTKNTDELSFKCGGGAGGVKAGITLGGAFEYGKTTVKISGTEFSGTVYNMPEAARNFGYAYAWKIAQYYYKNGSGKIPVVSYIVTGINSTSIIRPPRELDVDASKSTINSLTLIWDYDLNTGIDGFRVARREVGGGWTQVTNGTVAYDPARGEYSFTDQLLASGTEYTYRVVALRDARESIPSDTASGWTLVTDQLKVSLSAYELTIHPDRGYTVTSSVQSVADGGAVSYSWEKYTDGKWAAIGVTTAGLAISAPKSQTAGEYRLKVTQTVNNAPAMAYSPTLTLIFSKYEALISVTAKISGSDLILKAELTNAASGSGAVPEGAVTFLVLRNGVEQASPQSSIVTAMTPARCGTAAATVKDVPDGAYSVIAIYSGDGNFYYQEAAPVNLVKGSGNLYYAVGPENIYYSLPFTPTLWMATPSGEVTQITDASNAGGYSASFAGLEYISGLTWNTVTERLDVQWSAVDVDAYAAQVLEITPKSLLTNLSSTVRAIYTIHGPGSFTQDVYLNYKVKPLPVTVTARSFEVEQQNIVGIGVDTDYFSVANTVNGSAELPFSDKLSNYFFPWVYNNAGQRVTYRADATMPGIYTLKAEKQNNDPGYENYSFTLISGTITVVGAKYQVTTLVNNAGMGSVSVSPYASDLKYGYGANLTFTAAAVTGYEVQKWEAFVGASSTAAKTQTGGNTFQYILPTNDITVKTYFKEKNTTLTYGAQPTGSGVVYVDPRTAQGGFVLEGTPLEFSAYPADGYTFAEWWVYANGKTSYLSGDGSEVVGHINMTMPGYPMDVTAKFERAAYRVTLAEGLTATYLNGLGQTVTVRSGDYVTGDTVITIAPEAGQTVTAWKAYPTAGVFSEPGFNGIDQKCVYTVAAAADFDAEVTTFYTLTLVDPANGTISGAVSGRIEAGESVTLTAEANGGYAVGYWTQDSLMRDPGQTSVTFEMTGDMTVSHVFAAKTPDPSVTVTYDGTAMSCADADGNDVDSGDPVTSDTVLTFTAKAPAGHKIIKWTVTIDGVPVIAQTGGETYTLAMPDYDVAVAVETALEVFTVSLETNGIHGVYSLSAVGVSLDSVPAGTYVLLSVKPHAGWRVESVTRSSGVSFAEYANDVGGGVLRYAFNSPNADTVITLTYADDTDYVITVTPSSNGAVTAPAAAKAGDTVQLGIEPEDSYTLGALTVKKANGDSVVVGSNHAFTMPDANVTVTAAFVLEDTPKTSYIITYGTTANGTVLGAASAFNDDVVQLTVTPVNGYRLSALTVTKAGGGSVVVGLNYAFVMPEADVTVTALFEAVVNTGGGGGGGSPSPGAATPGAATPDFILDISAGGGRYRVPVDLATLVPKLNALLKENGLSAEDIIFKAELSNVSTDPTISAAFKSSVPKALLMGTIVDFKIYVVNSKTNEVISNAEALTDTITRMIPVSAKPQIRYGAFAYDKTNNSFVFVPHTAVLIDGQWYVAIQPRNSSGNSVYAVAQNEVGFTDAPKNHWAISYLERASAKRLVVGIGDGKYAPEDSVTRAEFVQMIANALWLPAASAETKAYGDIQAGDWYYAAVIQARSAGLLDKFTESGFMPNQAITREEMAAILSVVIKYEKYTVTGGAVNLQARFTDYGGMTAKYLEDIELVCRTELMQGVAESTFSPDGVTTRAQAATVLIRLLETLGMIDK